MQLKVLQLKKSPEKLVEFSSIVVIFLVLGILTIKNVLFPYALIGVFGLILLVVFSVRSDIALLLILITLPLEVFSWDELGVRIKAFQLITLLAIPGLVLPVLIRKKSISIPPIKPLILFLIIGILSFNNAVSKSQALVSFCLWLFSILFYFIIYNLSIINSSIIPRILFLIILVGNVIAIHGIIQWIGTMFGYNIIEITPINPYGRPTSVFLEAIWYGCYMMIMSILQISLYFSKYFKKWNRWLLIGFSISFVGLMVSLTRSAWVGFASGFIFLLLIFRWMSVKLLVFLLIILLIFFAFYRILIPHEFRGLTDRFKEILDPKEHAAQSRMLMISKALPLIKLHPIIGNGMGNYGIIFGGERGYGSEKLRPIGVVISTFLNILFDCGILGLMAFIWFLFSVFKPAFSRLNTVKNKYWKSIILAYLAILISSLTYFLFTPGHVFGFFWFNLAFLSAVTKLSLINSEKLSMIKK
jgi:hypothetical protein